MPTPQQLLTEMQTGPLAATIAPLIAAGNDAGIAMLLNTRAYRGYVPIVELSAFCTKIGLTGAAEVYATEPTSPTNPIEFKILCRTVLTILRDDYRLSVADVDDPAFVSATNTLVAAGLLSAANRDAIVAMAENHHSRAEVVWGLDTFITATEVAVALGRGGI